MKILLIGNGKVNKTITELYSNLVVGFIDDTAENIKETPNIIIDFSHPSLLDKTIELALKYRCPVLIGTTGYSEEKMAQIKELSNKLPLLISCNFSQGILLIKKIILDNNNSFNSYNKTIIERHNSLKKDSPSGTALMLEEIFKSNNIHSYREPFFIGEHEIILENSNEIITISHKVLNRSVFASGAIKAAYWLLNQDVGLYKLEDTIDE